MTVDETCGRLGIGRRSLYNEIAKGEIQIAKYGRRTFIPLSQVDAWIQRHMVAAT